MVLQKNQVGSSKSYTRDAAGRQSTSSITVGASNGSYTRSFDAMDRLLSQAYTTYASPSSRPDCSGNDSNTTSFNGTHTYKWGPNGHPIQIDGETLHWDGDTLLFTSNSSGVVDDVKTANLADINPSSSKMLVNDRDESGVVVSQHNADGFSGWSPTDAYDQRCAAGPPASSSSFATSYLNTPFVPITNPALDGLTDGINVLQGSHGFDNRTAQWVSPDAVNGGAMDLPGQKPLLWNRNNPQQFIDPSGNDALYLIFRGVPVSKNIANHAYLEYIANNGTTQLFEAGPGGFLNAYLVEQNYNEPAGPVRVTDALPTSLIGAIRRAYNFYAVNTRFYNLGPIMYDYGQSLYGYEAYNSNSFISGLLASIHVNVTLPSWLIAPDWNRPVPAEYFQNNGFGPFLGFLWNHFSNVVFGFYDNNDNPFYPYPCADCGPIEPWDFPSPD